MNRLASRPRVGWLLAGMLVILLAALLRSRLQDRAPVLKAAELQAFNDSAGTMLGRHVAGRFPGGRVLLIVRPGAENGGGTAEEKALLDGFRNAVEGKLQIAGIVAPQAPAGYREQLSAKVAAGEVLERDVGLILSTPSMWYDTRGLADLVRTRSEAISLIVSTTALPDDFPGAPELAAQLPPITLLLAPVLNPGRLLDSGRVEAMVVFKPAGAWTMPDAPEKDAVRAFDSRYLLIHAGNRGDMQRLHPGVFR